MRITVILCLVITVCEAQFFFPPTNIDFKEKSNNIFEQWLDIDKNTGIVRYHIVYKQPEDEEPVISYPIFDQTYQSGGFFGHASLTLSFTKNGGQLPFSQEFVLDVARIGKDRIEQISPYHYEILQELVKFKPIIYEAMNNPSKYFKPTSTIWKPNEIISPSLAKYLQMKGLLPFDTEPKKEADNPWSTFWKPSENIISSSYAEYIQSKSVKNSG
ncbi:uncharacterized protein [Diabrotica undecimpunctata]|uniref:uncharacterized protein n=1 Tax=Diabrotica undecimpunctata TaxID=50387 RepID=UPI003B63879D